MDSVRSGPYGQIFRPDNFIFGQVNCKALRNNRDTSSALCILVSILCCLAYIGLLYTADWCRQQLGKGPLHRGSRAHRFCS